jgi:hypothetical protein
MNLEEAKEWILVVSGSITLISVAVTAILAVKQYRLNSKGEQRLADSSRAETDVRLLKSFTELMDFAMGRRGHILSEKLVEELFKQDVFSKSDFNNVEAVNRKIGEYSILRLPVGESGQKAAFSAIATLALRYEVLRDAALKGLENLKKIEPQLAEECIQQIKGSHSPTPNNLFNPTPR